jgi:uncharacterized protein YneF (UPF0154 family)
MNRFDSIYQHWVEPHQDNYDTLPANPNLTPAQIDLLFIQGVSDSLDHNRWVKERLAEHSKLTPQQFQHLFDEYGYRDHLAMNPNLTTEQIDLIYSTPSVDTRLLGAYSKLTEEQVNRFLNDDEMVRDNVIDFLAQNPHLTSDQIDLIYNMEGVDKSSLGWSSKLTDEQFNRCFNDPDIDHEDLATNPNLTSEQIDLLYQKGGRYADVNRADSVNMVRKNLSTHAKLNDEQVALYLLSSLQSTLQNLAQNPHLTPDQIDLLYDEGNENTYDEYDAFLRKRRQTLAEHSVNLTDDQWARFVNDPDFEKTYLQKLALNPSINPLSQRNRTGIINWMW